MQVPGGEVIDREEHVGEVRAWSPGFPGRRAGHAIRAHEGNPQAGRVAQVVGGSGVRAAGYPLRNAIMAAPEAVAPSAGTGSGVLLVQAGRALQEHHRGLRYSHDRGMVFIRPTVGLTLTDRQSVCQ
jgi:hypothetical protein